MNPTDCPTCHSTGKPGYCAPRKCYCHHPECPAFIFDLIAKQAWRDKQGGDTE